MRKRVQTAQTRTTARNARASSKNPARKRRVFPKSAWARVGASLYLGGRRRAADDPVRIRENPMDDHDQLNEFQPATLTKEVVRRYERQSQNDFEIELFQGLLARNPDYVEVLKVLANNLAAKGDREGSLEVDRRLVRLRPNDAAAHYNFACSLCVMGSIDEAMDNLERALALGYSNLEYLTEDRDLISLHREPRFLRMLERLLEESEV